MKIKSLLATFCLALVFASCGDSEESLRQQYIEACANKDFDGARSAVEKIAAIAPDSRMDEHLKYVNDKEIYFLLANNSKDNANRVMYLFNTYEASQLPNMTDVLEVAVSQGNSYLGSKLIKGGVVPSKTTMDGAVSEDNEELVELILSKRRITFLTVQPLSLSIRIWAKRNIKTT